MRETVMTCYLFNICTYKILHREVQLIYEQTLKMCTHSVGCLGYVEKCSQLVTQKLNSMTLVVKYQYWHTILGRIFPIKVALFDENYDISRNGGMPN
jgi:hypothetical protein